MNISQLQIELEEDEGVKYEIYLDHLGKPTFGIGHLITSNDKEFGLPVGTSVSKDRVDECFEKDIKYTLQDCKILYYSSSFNQLPEEAQLVLANMMFNLGYSRLKYFKRMNAAIQKEDWAKVADEMIDSKWYTQVPNRAKRLVNRIISLTPPIDNSSGDRGC